MGKRLDAAFRDHPAEVGETYFEHFGVAMHFARELAGASMRAAVHAVVPGLCCTSASERVKSLHAEMTAGARGERDAALEAAAVAEAVEAVESGTGPVVATG